MHTVGCLIHAQEIKTVFAEVQPEVSAIPCGKRTKKSSSTIMQGECLLSNSGNSLEAHS